MLIMIKEGTSFYTIYMLSDKNLNYRLLNERAQRIRL